MLFAILAIGCQQEDELLIIEETSSVGLEDIEITVDTDNFSSRSESGKTLDVAVYKGSLTLVITNQADGDIRSAQFNVQGTADEIKTTLREY